MVVNQVYLGFIKEVSLEYANLLELAGKKR